MRLLWSLVMVSAACGDNSHATPDAAKAIDAKVIDATPDAPTLESELTPAQIAAIDAAIADKLGKGGATGYSIAVWRDGKIVHREAFGTITEDGRPTTVDTLFQIGSDTKKLTTIGLLRQVQAGRATLDQTVGELVPDLKLASDASYFSTLTLDELLSHRSGLFDYLPWTDAPDDAQLAAVMRGKFAANETAMMPAGIAWDYANPNFSIAGFVTEVLDGSRPWATIITDDVIVPLGLTHTFPRRDQALASGQPMASGHGLTWTGEWDSFKLLEGGPTSYATGWTVPTAQQDNAFGRPAGFVWSTAADQALTMGFLADGNEAVLSASLRTAMMTAHAPLDNHLVGESYGYGLFVEDGLRMPDGTYYAARLIEHDGATPSMTSFSLLLPDQRVAVTMLANGYGENFYDAGYVILQVVAADRLPAATSAPALLPPPATDLSTYAGTFTDPNLGTVLLTWNGSQLQLTSGALDTDNSPLTPLGLDLFSVSLQGGTYDLSFYDGTPGAHSYGVNRSFVLSRTTTSSMLAAPHVRHGTLRPSATPPRRRR